MMEGMQHLIAHYTRIEEESGGYRVWSRTSSGSPVWSGRSALFFDEEDVQAVARLTAKACYIGDMRSHGITVETAQADWISGS